MKTDFEIIVVGAGHAGCEAAVTAAKLGCSTLLITLDMTKMAQLSCNPAMGGIAKGQIVREIDALGGETGRISDACSIQHRMLNRSKGPAMWSPRVQLDRAKFVEKWREKIESTDGLFVWQDSVVNIITDKSGRCTGVKTQLEMTFTAQAVILTTGTFLGGLLHYGKVMIPGGRCSEPASEGLSYQLAKLGHAVGRMKTGTPARIDGRTVDWDQTTPQESDPEWVHFSFIPPTHTPLKQRPCHLFYTTPESHKVLREALDQSPLYNGQIASIGPRYCPSIETKIVNFAARDRHQLFLEPEGENTNEYYLNGFSSSLPVEVQIRAIKQIPALKNAQLYRPGYAIEYDFCYPTDLDHSLESKKVPRLFMAGQINGTTGYEEAAAQGLIAAINAAQTIKNKPKLYLRRDQAYIGVLIDDLVTKGVDEPYRMFTSRAEFRTLLRQDNADQRLTPFAIELGLADSIRTSLFEKKTEAIQKLHHYCGKTSVKPTEVNSLLEREKESSIEQAVKINTLLLRPNVHLKDLIQTIPSLKDYVQSIAPQEIQEEIVESTEIDIKYQGYIEREKQQAEKLARLEALEIDGKFDYNTIEALSLEAREKLSSHRPKNIAQAQRIPGISPNDIALLLVLLGR